MKKVFEGEGMFVEYEEKKVKFENGYELIYRCENLIEFWWKLKEVIKGRKVKIVVYELEESED